MFSRNSSPAMSSAATAAQKNVTTGTFIQEKNIRNVPQAILPVIVSCEKNLPLVNVNDKFRMSNNVLEDGAWMQR